MAPPDDEAAAAAKDRAQRRAANEKEISDRVSRPNFLVTRQSPVNKQQYGIFVRAVERDLSMVIQFKTSKKSPFVGYPLHWAVLGREHAAIEQLIMYGADASCQVPELGVTVTDICKANQSLETLEVVRRAVAKREAADSVKRDAAEKREAILAEREAMRKKAVEDAAATELEDKLAAEREAAGEAAAAEEGAGGGGAGEEAQEGEGDE
jgi:hypothetical protein